MASAILETSDDELSENDDPIIDILHQTNAEESTDDEEEVGEVAVAEGGDGGEGGTSAVRGRGRGRPRGSGRGRGSSGRGGTRNCASWVRDTGIDIAMPAFNAAQAGPVPPPTPPVHVIDLFLTPDVVEMVRKESTRRAYIELSSSSPPRLLENFEQFTTAEINAFFAIIILMGIRKLPSEEDYWSEDPLFNTPFVRSLMSYSRFRILKHCLMVANPKPEETAADKLAKMRPFINAAKEIIHSRYQAQQNLSLDESLCQRGHRNNSRISHRGETKKPISDHIKIISLHCAHSEYCLDFVVDTRTQTTPHDMVLEVCAALPHQPYRIATDRMYTSVDTARALYERGLYMYGPVRTDRGIDRALLSSLSTAMLSDGEHRWSMAPPSLLSCVWRDTTKGIVWFLSTCHDGRAPAGQVSRCMRGQPRVKKSAPMVAVDYNKFMGGCDRADSLYQSYNAYLTHKKRWYMSLFYYIFDVLLVNALIYRNLTSSVDNQLTHKKFRYNVIQLLVSRASQRVRTPTAVKRTKRDVLPAIRLTPGPHFVAHSPSNHNCQWCYKRFGRSCATPYKCFTCNIHLHPDCFMIYHDPDVVL